MADLPPRTVSSAATRRMCNNAMKLVVGLGNPGVEYEGTRHNIGAEVIGLLAARAGCGLKRKWRLQAWAGQAVIGGETVTLARPRTFMNVSGAAVASLAHWLRCSPGDLIVVSDDIALDLGRIRIRPGGGAGGHKGLESVIAALGTEGFARVRVGVGAPRGDQVRHVLGRFAGTERPAVDEARERAALAVEEILARGVGPAMNRFNGPEAE